LTSASHEAKLSQYSKDSIKFCHVAKKGLLLLPSTPSGCHFVSFFSYLFKFNSLSLNEKAKKDMSDAGGKICIRNALFSQREAAKVLNNFQRFLCE
jgi:hypothetical protein